MSTLANICLALFISLSAHQPSYSGTSPAGWRRVQTPSQRPLNARQVARKVLPSVVYIQMEGAGDKPGCYGSGFFVTPTQILTNKHVVTCSEAERGTVRLAGGQRSYLTRQIAAWPDLDVALVETEGLTAAPLQLDTARQLSVGDDIFVAGNPEGLEGTFTRGIVSGVRSQGGLLQIDAPVSPGSSGGPVVDAYGRVVGVTVSSIREGQNLNFAIPARVLAAPLARMQQMLARIRKGGARPNVEAKTRKPAASPTPRDAKSTMLSPALRTWESNPDWGRYVSVVIGDTAIKDDLKTLIDAGLSVNTRDRRGRTALHVAAMLGQVELARYLVARGASINAMDAEGRTPLMLAASIGGFDSFKRMTSPWESFWTEPLCRMDTDRTTTRHNEEVMQWYAMWQAERPMTLFLLGIDADVNTVTREGRTALDYAAMGGLTDFDELIRQTGRLRNESECSLKLTESPALRGFKLGMSLREVTARFRPFTMPETDACGRLNLDFNEARGALSGLALKPRELTSISRLRLTFVDERLAYMRITYARQSTVSNPQEFRTALSASLSLPGKWRATGGGDNWDHAHVVGCDGFKVVTGYLVRPYVELHDVEALRTLLRRKTDEEVRRRREAEREQEQRKREFKP